MSNERIEGIFESDDEIFEPLMAGLCKNLKFFEEGEIISEARTSIFKKEPHYYPGNPNTGAIIEYRAFMRFFDNGVFSFGVYVLVCVNKFEKLVFSYQEVALAFSYEEIAPEDYFKRYVGKPAGIFEMRFSNDGTSSVSVNFPDNGSKKEHEYYGEGAPLPDNIGRLAEFLRMTFSK